MLKQLMFIAIGIGLYSLSRTLEARGDAAPLLVGAVSAERLKFHLSALVLLAGSLGCFIAALVTFFRKNRK